MMALALATRGVIACQQQGGGDAVLGKSRIVYQDKPFPKIRLKRLKEADSYINMFIVNITEKNL